MSLGARGEVQICSCTIYFLAPDILLEQHRIGLIVSILIVLKFLSKIIFSFKIISIKT